ncbi:MAG TPA: carboxypeptidase-like regulatory domain-containing protein, partial [Longimicrobiales bacterium]
MPSPRAFLLAVCALALLSRAALAQAPLPGQVLDPAGKPVAGQRVTLHEVNQASGAMVDSALTDAQGRFTVRVPTPPDTNTIFFVATRWQGELFIGTPFRPPLPAGVTYT